MYNIYEALRDERKLKDTDVAREAGINQAILSYWKYGRNKPKYETIAKIAKALHVSPSVFYEGVTNEPDSK